MLLYHPPSPLHTRRLKSQHHEIITTFPNSTPRYGFALGGGVHRPSSSPALRLSLWALFSLGWWFSSAFDDVSSPYPAFALPRLEHLHGRQDSSWRLCHRRPGTRFAVRENITTGHGRFPCSLSFMEGLPSPDTNAITDNFYGNELGLPLFLLFSSRSDRLAPYCYFTFLAGTHNYLAGIHNYFFTFRTLTTVHRGFPLGGWYCAISFLFSSVLPIQRAMQAPPGLSLGESGHPRTDCAGTSQVVTALFNFCFFFLSGWGCHGFSWLFLLVLWFDSFRLSF